MKISNFIAMLPIIAMLSGCNEHNIEELTAEESSKIKNDAARAANDKLSSDKVMAKEVLTKLQESNPSITDAYFSLNDKNQQVLVISKVNGDGSITQWTSDPVSDMPGVKEATQKSAEQQATQGSNANASSWLLPALVGAMSGYAISNMMNSSRGSTSNFSNYGAYEKERERRSAAYSGYVHNATQQSARSSYMNSSQYKSNPVRATSQPGVSRGAVAGSGSGARSASMGAGG